MPQLPAAPAPVLEAAPAPVEPIRAAFKPAPAVLPTEALTAMFAQAQPPDRRAERRRRVALFG